MPKCRDLRAFLRVKSGLLILVRVKDLTFSNSGHRVVQLKDSNGAQVFGKVFLQILKCISPNSKMYFNPPNYNKLQLKHTEGE